MMRKSKYWVMGLSFFVLSGVVFAYGNFNVGLESDVSQSDLSRYDVMVDAYAKERDLPSSKVDKISIRYYVNDDSGDLLHKGYNYEMDNTYVDISESNLKVDFTPTLEIEAYGDIYYSNNITNTDSKGHRYTLGGIAKEEIISPIKNMERYTMYANYVESNYPEVGSTTGLPHMALTTEEFGNLSPLVGDIRDNCSIGDTEPYTFFLDDKTAGIIIYKTKDDIYNIVRFELDDTITREINQLHWKLLN